jgi:hypothetical protein
MRECHYLGPKNTIGARVKYLLILGARLVGAIIFCPAAYRPGLRHLCIGWDEETRLGYLPDILNNNSFLILPWVTGQNPASHTPALALGHVCVDWKSRHG